MHFLTGLSYFHIFVMLCIDVSSCFSIYFSIMINIEKIGIFVDRIVMSKENFYCILDKSQYLYNFIWVIDRKKGSNLSQCFLNWSNCFIKDSIDNKQWTFRKKKLNEISVKCRSKNCIRCSIIGRDHSIYFNYCFI
jgi:hypothetical protein